MSPAQVFMRRAALAAAIIVVMIYLGGAFVEGSLNPAAWTQAARENAVTGAGIAIAVVTFMCLLSIA
jgi:hypothetical protein